MSENFQGWYAGKVEKKIKAGQNTSDVAVINGIPVMREHIPRWLIDFYQYIQKKTQQSLFCWQDKLPYVSKLGLLFPVENHVNVFVYRPSGICKSTKSVVFNLTEGS